MRMLLRLIPLLVFLAGCASAPPQKIPQQPSVTAPTPARDDPAAPAYEALANRDYTTAASLFEALTFKANSPKLEEYQLSTAEALLGAERLPEAAQMLARIQTRALDAYGHTRMQLLEARLALQHRDANRALSILAAPRSPSMPLTLLGEYHRLRGRAFEQLGNFMEAAREYVARGPRLVDPAEQISNQHAIWDTLAQLSSPDLVAAATKPAPDILTGWIELAHIGKSLLMPAQLEERLRQWTLRFPGHPADPVFQSNLRARAAELTARPRQIALLLPYTGSFQEPATAVRDGVMAGYYADPARNAVVLRSYDVGSNPQDVTAVYEQAVREGAEFVIGPLTKEAVDVLAKHGTLPVPTLALNAAEAGAGPNFYQFPLLPEDEAAQVAERAWRDGHTRAAVIAPEGPWGTRMAQAFNQQWQSFGGSLIATVSYASQDNDFSTEIRRLLLIDSSNRRQQQLESILGRNVEFTPRRRQDIDFVFLAAFPKQARLLRPQLNFHHAQDLPAYSTSHIYTGTVLADQDRDMDGVVFGDMPWVLDEAQPASLKRYEGQLKRLVALGRDAYGLIPYLRLLKRFPDERFDGATGNLRVDDEQRVRRQLAWARFTSGRPRPSESPVRTGTP